MSNQTALSVEDDARLWEEESERALREGAKLREPYEREEYEKARLKAEQEAIEAKRRVELFVAKGTLSFSEPLAIEVCERVSSGELLINICVDEHMPTVRRVTQWIKENPEFAALYKESINDRLTIFEEEVIKIADDASRDFRDVVRHGRPTRVLDGEAIARAKLRVEVRFRHLKAGNPGKWGDSTTIISKSEDDTIAAMPLDELENKLAELEHKDRVVKEDRRSQAA
jgi:hypothetical protein